ncbi:hypothetical protein ACTXT7_015301, partial [Hymenolepis weldensis]
MVWRAKQRRQPQLVLTHEFHDEITHPSHKTSLVDNIYRHLNTDASLFSINFFSYSFLLPPLAPSQLYDKHTVVVNPCSSQSGKAVVS